MKKIYMLIIGISILMMSCNKKTVETNNEPIINPEILKLETENKELKEEIENLKNWNKVLENNSITMQIDIENLNDKLENEYKKNRVENFIYPVPEKYKNLISSQQGLRNALKTNTGGTTLGTYHHGIDIPVPYKTQIYAAKDGYVIDCYPGRFNGKPGYYKGHPVYGSCILIQHYDNTQSFYAHLSRTDIKEGDYVKQGQQIALSGGTGQASGQSTGNHLHFAIFINISNLLK